MSTLNEVQIAGMSITVPDGKNMKLNDLQHAWLTSIGVPLGGTINERFARLFNTSWGRFDPNNKGLIMVLSEQNHRMNSSSTAGRGVAFATHGMVTGKWYWEMLSLTAVTAQGMGIGQVSTNLNDYLGLGAGDWGYFPTGAYWTAAALVGTGLPYGLNSVVGFALDMGGNLDVYVDGVQSFSVAHGLTGLTWAAGSDASTGGVCNMVINCGDNGTFGGRVTAGGNADDNGFGNFKYPVPAGYQSLVTVSQNGGKTNELQHQWLTSQGVPEKGTLNERWYQFWTGLLA